MIDFAFGVVDAFFQLLFVLGGLLFAGVGGLIMFYPLWQRLFAVRVKARIVALYADHAPRSLTPPTDVVQKPIKNPIAAVIFVLLITLPMLGFSGYFVYKFFNLKQTGVRVEAQVISYVEVPDSDGGSSTYAPVVRFTDASGVVREERERSSSSNHPFREGQDVIVYYKAGDPTEYIIDDFWHNMILPMIFSGFGLFGLLMLALMPKGSSSSRSKTSASLYYPEYEYVTPDGRLVRAQTNEGSSWLSGKLPGTEAFIYLGKNDYDTPASVSIFLSIFGLLFFVPGLFMLNESVPQLTFGWPLLVAVIGLVALSLIKVQGTLRTDTVRKMRLEFFNYMQGKKKIGFKSRPEKNGVLLSQVDIDMLSEQHDRSLKRWAPIHVLICAGMIYGGWYLHQSQTAFERQALKAEGQVVRLITERSDDSTMYYPLISYITHSGAVVEFKDNVGGSSPSLQEGDSVAVLYVADDPRGAIVDRGWFNQAPGIGLMAVGGLFLLLLLKGLNSAFGRKVRHN